MIKGLEVNICAVVHQFGQEDIQHHLPYRLKLQIMWGTGNIFCSIFAQYSACFLTAVTCTLYRCKVRLRKAAESRKLFYCAYSEGSWCWNKLAESLQVQESSVSATGPGDSMSSNTFIIIYTKLNCLVIVCTFQFFQLTRSCIKVHCQTHRKIVKPGIWADNFHSSWVRWL